MNGSEGSSALSEAQLNFSDKATMNYETLYTDAPVEPSPRENSNQSGTTLKEHDYIGLSEVSSANSSNDKHPESGRREVLDLNESATVLRLGPPAAPKPDVREPIRDVRDPVRDVREPVTELEFAKTSLGGVQRNNAILQEFRQAQAMKAAQHAPHAQMMKSANPNLPMYHRPKGYEAGQKGKYPTSFHAPYNVFSGVKNNGVKRGYSETVGMHLTGLSGASGAARDGHCDVNRGEGMGMCMGATEQPDVKVKLQQGKTWMSLDKSNGSLNPFNGRRTLPQDAGDSSNKVSNEVKKHSLNEAMAPASNDQSSPPPQNQTVGWPPVRSFVRNNNPVKPAPPPPAPTTTCPSVQGKDTPSSTNSKSCFVKIYMDGVPFGRKVDLKTNNRYEKLYPALEEMFQQFISGHYSGSQTSSSAKSHFVSPSRKLNFLDGSEYVLIYEDHEGDFMLVGDVPWELFVNTVKRLRIMKGSEEVNLAPKNADPVKTQPAVG